MMSETIQSLNDALGMSKSHFQARVAGEHVSFLGAIVHSDQNTPTFRTSGVSVQMDADLLAI